MFGTIIIDAYEENEVLMIVMVGHQLEYIVFGTIILKRYIISD